MNDGVSLIRVKAGEDRRVVRIVGGFGVIRKLNLLGIKEGKTIRKVSSQPMRGPVVIEVGGSQVAIGHGMARRIIVEGKP
jgi:ferrous iron transport protein A